MDNVLCIKNIKQKKLVGAAKRIRERNERVHILVNIISYDSVELSNNDVVVRWRQRDACTSDQ